MDEERSKNWVRAGPRPNIWSFGFTNRNCIYLTSNSSQTSLCLVNSFGNARCQFGWPQFSDKVTLTSLIIKTLIYGCSFSLRPRHSRSPAQVRWSLCWRRQAINQRSAPYFVGSINNNYKALASSVRVIEFDSPNFDHRHSAGHVRCR